MEVDQIDVTNTHRVLVWKFAVKARKALASEQGQTCSWCSICLKASTSVQELHNCGNHCCAVTWKGTVNMLSSSQHRLGTDVHSQFTPSHQFTSAQPWLPPSGIFCPFPENTSSTWGSLYTVSLRKCTLMVILLTYHRTLGPHSTWNMAFRLSRTHPLNQACLHDVPKLEEAEGSVRLIFISSTQNRV